MPIGNIRNRNTRRAYTPSRVVRCDLSLVRANAVSRSRNVLMFRVALGGLYD